MNNTFQTLRRNRLTAAMLSALALPFAAMAQDGRARAAPPTSTASPSPVRASPAWAS